ncbi:MAG: autotransporter domain-containing protein [Hyphomonadaceae bacterium]
MRIKRKIQLAGIAMVMAGVGAGAAHAGDVTITTDTTTPLSTSNPDGSGVAGDITVAESGSITAGAGQSAITVNSSNDAILDGDLISNNADNSVGIRIVGGNSGTIRNSGAILLQEDATLTDTDSDGDLDGNFAQGLNRNGIFLQAGPTFTGDILGDGLITIEGNNSAGIRLDSLLTGAVNYTGAITINGENSIGMAINAGGGVTGNVSLLGPLTMRGQNSIGVLVDAPIGGELSLSGAWSVTGYHSVSVPANPSALEAEDMEQAGPSLQINNNIAGGVTLEGIGVENDPDDDGDGTANEADDNTGLALNHFGSAPAVLIQADGGNLLIGANAAGFAYHQRGAVSVGGVFNGVSVTGVRIQGDGLGATATLTGGMAIDNSLSAGAAAADAYSLYLGAGAIVPQILVRGTVLTQVFSDPAFTSYGVFIGAGANAPTFNNSGAITANYLGETGNAVAIVDQSGTLNSITNSGQIIARVIATDADLTDDVPPPPVTGTATAIDLSTSAANVSLQQVAPTAFTDDDAVDDNVAAAPSIIGDIRLGAGNDTVNLLAGSITGDIAFGLGNDSFTINNGAVFSGQLSDTNGTLAINVVDGALNVQGGALNIASATFGAGAELGVLLSDVPADSTNIQASGMVTFAPGAVVTPIVPAGLPQAGSHVFLTAAGGLVGAANVTGPQAGASTPFLYDISIVLSAPNALSAVFDLRTATELGLSANQSIAYEPILTALRLDPEASAAIAAITTEYEFFDAYEDLLPNYSSASTEIAATAIQQMQSATSNRMAATRMHGLDEVSVWGQEIAYGLNRDPASANTQEFRGNGFGFAGGIDGPTNGGAIFGLSASFIASEVEEPGRPEGEISAWFGQANAYYATAVGAIDLDFIIGAGAGKMQSRRFVEIGNPVAFSALSEADWLAYEGHGAVRASAPMSAGWVTITPQAALTYVGISEDGYTEEGGGVIDYQVDSAFSQRLWGDVGVELSARWELGANAVVAPRLYGGYRANLIDDETERTVRFVSGGAPFTLTDEGVGEGGPLVGIGFDASNGYSTFSLGYEGEFGDQIERHSINAAIRFRF